MVIGLSNGNTGYYRYRRIVSGFEALKKLVCGFAEGYTNLAFTVWHMSPDIRGVLPQVLNPANTLQAAQVYDIETIEPNRIYVAPLDRHLLVEHGRVRVTRCPKENRFRPNYEFKETFI